MGGEESREKASTSTVDTDGTIATSVVTARRPKHRKGEQYMVLWVDENIDSNNPDCKNTLAQLHIVVNEVKQCTKWKECIEWLNKNREETFHVIVSGGLGQSLVPSIHSIPNLDSIYIFCGNQQRHEEWARRWSKIKGVHTSINPICDALKLTIKHRNQDNVRVSIIGVNEGSSNENINQLDPTFMYSQLFKETLLELEYGEQIIKDFAKFLKKEEYYNNKKEKKMIKEFGNTYERSNAIRWYTRECFMYKLLNEALRTLNGDLIIRMGFFLCDLHRQIERLYQNQVSQYCGKTFQLYRGQGLSTTDFNKLESNKGGLISFNNFLSTSKKRDISLHFANKSAVISDTVGIIFQILIDPTVSLTPFASIQELSDYEDEDEILFTTHSVFRIGEIRKIDNNLRLYEVDLKFTADEDKQLRKLTDRIRHESESPTGWCRLGKLLLKIGQFDKAEELYRVLLEQTTNDNDRVFIYHQLGLLSNEKGKYTEAASFYEMSLKLNQRNLPEDHPSLANTYNNLGQAYQNMDNYSKALEFYDKARRIKEKTLAPYNPDLAIFYGNIGQVYSKMCQYEKALEFYEKDLEITRIALPPNHPNLATSYNNMGQVYSNMGNYTKALEFHEKALRIRQISLPPQHPSLAISYNNIGSLYSKIGDYHQALSYLQKALAIWQNSFSSTHPLIETALRNINYVKNKM
ncbi:unnamed protein product [Rotaria magnacalcarata]|uniref:Kinesin light chain n=2 Tax=Rotaria magnacalcarata TaxID=392030 RepID=A0A816NJ92_9BILA|nr:unnamed protein product [Rotaria magnacalcarata]